MATEKQIAAYRVNATRSTGPKTVLGKKVSSRNAFRHGLSCPLPPTSPKVQAIVRALTEGDSDADWAAVVEFANAQYELLKIQAILREMMLGREIESLNMHKLRRRGARPLRTLFLHQTQAIIAEALMLQPEGWEIVRAQWELSLQAGDPKG